jgi:hypothetical protein
MKKGNEKKDWSVVDFPVALRLWFAARCKLKGKTITKGLEEILNKLKNGEGK